MAEAKTRILNPLQRQLLINISEILAKQGFISEEEKNRLKVLLSSEYE